MKEFIKKNFTVIVLVIAVLSFFKSCGDGRELASIKKEIREIKDSSVTRDEFAKEMRIMGKELQISGLESEKRMIQATDRKLLDVRRQTEIEEEIKRLRTK